jgi:hypothetical protein
MVFKSCEVDGGSAIIFILLAYFLSYLQDKYEFFSIEFVRIISVWLLKAHHPSIKDINQIQQK